MKKFTLILVILVAAILQLHATKRTVTISGFNYSPALLTVHTGDTVTINASASHPLLEVSKATWDNSGTTALSGGFGPTTKNFTFTAGAADTIYYICTEHVQFGMKGRVIIAPSSGIIDLPEKSLSLSLFPNPIANTGMLSIYSPASNNFSVQVFNITGQLAKDLTPADRIPDKQYSIPVDASNLSEGTYFIVAISGGQKIVRKFEVIR